MAAIQVRGSVVPVFLTSKVVVGFDLTKQISSGSGDVVGVGDVVDGCLAEGVCAFVAGDITMARNPFNKGATPVTDLASRNLVKLACAMLALPRAMITLTVGR